MALAMYNYKYVIKAVPIADITISETGETTAIEPIPTFINLDVLTEGVENWLMNVLPESMANNSYIDRYTGDLYTFYNWVFYEEGIANFPYVKEIASSSEGVELSSVEWFAGLPEGKVYFAYVEVQGWWGGKLQMFSKGSPFIFRLPFLPGDNQLGTNLISRNNYTPE